jgi:peptidoglycan/LPS O-acetylase OafA/YrhL
MPDDVTDAMRPTSLPALTGLRFFAASVVLWSHFAPSPLFTRSDAGPSAVSLFFLLSGFILTYTAPPGRVRVREFYAARLARIYPVYLLGLDLALVTTAGPTPTCPSRHAALLPSLFAVQAWFQDRVTCLNNPAWSVSCEVFFYALFPLLLPLVRRVPQRRLPRVGVACWLLSLLLSGAFLLRHPTVDLGTLSGGGTLFRWLHFSPPARLPEFICGIVLGRLYLSGVRVPRPALALIVSLGWLPVVWYGVGLFGPLDDDLCLPAFAVLLLVLAQPGAVSRALAHPAVVALGEASYGLYIMHWPLHGLVVRAGLVSPLLGGWASFGAYTLLCVAVSLVSLRVLEAPARRAIRACLAPPYIPATR